jgi:hypothetical protein
MGAYEEVRDPSDPALKTQAEKEETVVIMCCLRSRVNERSTRRWTVRGILA